MTNTLELEIALKRVGKTKREAASALGITEQAFWQKPKNITEFKASEIDVLYRFLRLKDL